MADGNANNRVMLRKILYRIDFQIITEKMQEQLFEFVAEEFGEFFENKQQELANGIEIEINPVSISQTKASQRTQPVFVFSQPHTTECDGRQLKIGRTFLFLEIELNIETMGISYYEWIAKIVGKMQTFPIFHMSRVGLRKFNSFFLLDEDKGKLKDFFKIDYLTEIDSPMFSLDNFNYVQSYNCTPYVLQFTRGYSTGALSNEQLKINDQLAHLITFDFDLFTIDFDKMSAFAKDAKSELENMNNTIYSFFSGVVNNSIIDKINQGDLLDELGVIPF